MLRKIFPSDAESSFENSFKIILISEGYQSSESASFASSCIDFVDLFLDKAPFNLTRINSNWISVYSSFIASNNSGASIDSAAPANRTAFESSINTTTKLLSFNEQKINDHLDAETFLNGEDVAQFDKYIGKGEPVYGKSGCLPVLLLPAVAGHPSGGEYEKAINNNDYYFVATTQDGEWHQVIIRAVCKLLGLGDEYELEGSNFLAPSTDDAKSYLSYPNVQYFEQPPLTVTGLSKWYSMFSVTKRSMPPEIHAKTGLPSAPDNSINVQLTSNSEVAFWEGAAGYRTKVYRSSADCLLRRKIGHPQLLVRQQSVSFCPVCLQFLKTLIT